MRLLPLVLMLACNSGPTGPGNKTDESGTPAGAAAGTPAGTAAGSTPAGVGDVGQVLYWWQDLGGPLPTQEISAAFAPHFDGMAVPAACGPAGVLCYDALPTVEGDYIDPSPTTYDAFEVGSTWVGNTISVGGFQVPFRVDPETGFGGYRVQMPGSALPILDVILAGEWGEWTGLDVVPAAAPLLGLSPEPGEFIALEDSLDLAWTPNPDAAIVYLLVESPTASRIWLLPDSGTLSIPVDDMPPIDEGALYDIRLYQVVTAPEQTATGSNRIQGQAWSVAGWRAGTGGSNFSCAQILASNPASASGVYSIQPDPALPVQNVYCDMATDGGGWTLVASSRDATFDDARVGYSATLETTTPTTSMAGIWSGMRAIITGLSDIRFTCKKQVAAPDMFVDLSFYDVGWYTEITTGTDTDSCFSENNGVGAGPPPSRRNNKTGVVLAAGDQWGAGYLEGEDSCGDTGDFTVDFDDRGMDSNQNDGTDWGEDDSSQKCGDAAIGAGGAWFIWVRE